MRGQKCDSGGVYRFVYLRLSVSACFVLKLSMYAEFIVSVLTPSLVRLGINISVTVCQ